MEEFQSILNTDVRFEGTDLWLKLTTSISLVESEVNTIYQSSTISSITIMTTVTTVIPRRLGGALTMSTLDVNFDTSPLSFATDVPSLFFPGDYFCCLNGISCLSPSPNVSRWSLCWICLIFAGSNLFFSYMFTSRNFHRFFLVINSGTLFLFSLLVLFLNLSWSSGQSSGLNSPGKETIESGQRVHYRSLLADCLFATPERSKLTCISAALAFTKRIATSARPARPWIHEWVGQRGWRTRA